MGSVPGVMAWTAIEWLVIWTANFTLLRSCPVAVTNLRSLEGANLQVDKPERTEILLGWSLVGSYSLQHTTAWIKPGSGLVYNTISIPPGSATQWNVFKETIIAASLDNVA
ncbi:hypothetical protein TNCV_1500391 [Trichonephila clavipes]|nr:hypothetical protein TNCV_1500391 [Trichonephila clavipes]